MPEIFVRPDTLDAENARFDQALLRHPVFLNSVPKSGSHLLRNIMRMFVPVSQQYAADFIQWATLPQHQHAFDPASPRLSWGHLFFADASVVETLIFHRGNCTFKGAFPVDVYASDGVVPEGFLDRVVHLNEEERRRRECQRRLEEDPVLY